MERYTIDSKRLISCMTYGLFEYLDTSFLGEFFKSKEINLTILGSPDTNYCFVEIHKDRTTKTYDSKDIKGFHIFFALIKAVGLKD